MEFIRVKPSKNSQVMDQNTVTEIGSHVSGEHQGKVRP